ncbi:uncharacterized protein LOC135567654 [Oncorhynchus nerka]|uniref:uncharacterized protein LOC135567654 n=1 Tax=Oncorhynchus nerka TaxID=8023 RepID=UPI0031B80CBB
MTPLWKGEIVTNTKVCSVLLYNPRNCHGTCLKVTSRGALKAREHLMRVGKGNVLYDSQPLSVSVGKGNVLYDSQPLSVSVGKGNVLCDSQPLSVSVGKGNVLCDSQPLSVSVGKGNVLCDSQPLSVSVDKGNVLCDSLPLSVSVGKGNVLYDSQPLSVSVGKGNVLCDSQPLSVSVGKGNVLCDSQPLSVSVDKGNVLCDSLPLSVSVGKGNVLYDSQPLSVSVGKGNVLYDSQPLSVSVDKGNVLYDSLPLSVSVGKGNVLYDSQPLSVSVGKGNVLYDSQPLSVSVGKGNVLYDSLPLCVSKGNVLYDSQPLSVSVDKGNVLYDSLALSVSVDKGNVLYDSQPLSVSVGKGNVLCDSLPLSVSVGKGNVLYDSLLLSVSVGKGNVLYDSLPPVCPVCHAVLPPGELQEHMEQEMGRLAQLQISTNSVQRNHPLGATKTLSLSLHIKCEGGSPTSLSCPPEEPHTDRYQTFLRVRTNRHARLNVDDWCYAKPAPLSPHNRSHLTPDCKRIVRIGKLKRRSPYVGQDILLDLGGEEWGERRRIRMTSILGGCEGSVFVSSSTSKESRGDRAADLDVDGDDTLQYGRVQCMEADIPCSGKDPGVVEEREALRGAVLNGGTLSNRVTLEHSKWTNEGSPSTSNGESNKLDNSIASLHRTCKHSDIDMVSELTTLDSLRSRIRDLEKQLSRGDRHSCLICRVRRHLHNTLTSIQCWHAHCEECWLRTLVCTGASHSSFYSG